MPRSVPKIRWRSMEKMYQQWQDCSGEIVESVRIRMNFASTLKWALLFEWNQKIYFILLFLLLSGVLPLYFEWVSLKFFWRSATYQKNLRFVKKFVIRQQVALLSWTQTKRRFMKPLSTTTTKRIKVVNLFEFNPRIAYFIWMRKLL